MTTCQCLVPRYFREEHKAHSPKCEFLLLNKKEEDWTVEDLLELETKRQINRMVMVLQSQKLLLHPRIKITMFG